MNINNSIKLSLIIIKEKNINNSIGLYLIIIKELIYTLY